MRGDLLLELRRELRGEVLADEPLARHTSWRIGGPADLFVAPADRGDLLAALRLLDAAGCPWLALGGGSNLLVRDGGFRGAVLHTGHINQAEFGADGTVRVGGGLPLAALIREAARRGLAGLEELAGIPGSVGGAVTMNAGAGGQETGGTVLTVTVAGPDGEEELPAERLHFGYRSATLPAGAVVVEALLQLHPADPAALEESVRRRIGHRRAAHAVGGPNAGSVFKNPAATQAWRLIEAAGMRGAAVGGAAVAEAHANFIINRGGASAADVLALIDRVRNAVLQQSGVLLEPEVRVVGESLRSAEEGS